MATRRIEADIILQGEKAFNDAMKSVNNNLKNLKSEMASATAEFADNADSIEALTKKQNILQQTYEQQKEKISAYEAMLEAVKKKYGENCAAADKLTRELNYANVELNKTKKALQDVKKKHEEAAKTQEKYTSLIKRSSSAIDDAKSKLKAWAEKVREGAESTPVLAEALDALSISGSAAGKGLELGAKGIGVVIAAATAAVAALNKIEQETEQYRENQAKLNAAFDAAGLSAELASSAYTELYKVLGDNDKATESAQLLAQIAKGEEDIATWADIAAGVTGAFGDALPINSLVEAANETAKTASVTGVLADALNWVGLSEDEFNAKLSACADETERTALITDTLASAYNDAGSAFRENNKTIIAANEAQAQMDATMARLGGSIGEVKNRLIAEFMPSISEVIGAFADFVEGADGAEEALQDAINNMLDNLVEKLPEFLDFGVDLIIQIATGIVKSFPDLMAKLPEIIDAILGSFDELIPGLWDIGVGLVEGLWSGITSMAEWLWGKITGFVGGIKNLFTGSDGFDTHSPSKWSEGVFENVMAGGVVGVDKGRKALSDSFGSVLTQLQSDMQNFGDINAGFDITGTLGSGGKDAIIGQSGNQSNVSTINIYPQSLTQAQIDYVIDRANRSFGGAL